jgi:hypothetical protein
VQNGHTNRVPCALGMFSTITAQPGLQMRIKTWGAGLSFDASFDTGLDAALAAGLAAAFVACLRTGFRAVRRVVRRVVLVAVI